MINFIVNQCKDIFFTFIQKKHIINKVLEINKKIHKNKNSNKKKNIILVEFSNLHSSFLPFSLFSKILSEKFDSRIFAYDAFMLHSKLSQIKFFFKKILFLHIYEIYKSFGVEKFINIDSKLFKNAQIKKKILKNVNKIKNNSDLINFKIDNIYIGDLIYDTYLKKFSKETINIKSHKFRSFFKVCLKDYFFWKNFFI